MRLSEAIRLGAMTKPQAIGGLYEVVDHRVAGDVLCLKTQRIASCALGAAFEAAACRTGWSEESRGTTMRGEQSSAGHLVTYTPVEWEDVLRQQVHCPCCEHSDVVTRLIPHLNDQHLLTRERIADFIERLENMSAAAWLDGQNAERTEQA